ncbi:MAG: hypothetical protein ACI4A7_08000 [Prevotella sp.]
MKQKKIYQHLKVNISVMLTLLSLLLGSTNTMAATEMTVTSATMTSGDEVVDLMNATIEKLIADGTVTIATNMDEQVGCMQWQLVDANSREVVKNAYCTSLKNEQGHWDFWIPIDFLLYSGEDYELIVEGWESEDARNYDEPSLGTASFIIHGATEAYKYSDVTLVSPAELHFDSSYPEFELQSADDNKIQLVFSGAVTIEEAFVALGSGATEACKVTMSDDNTTATIEISSDVISSYTSFMVSVLAKDMEGLTVKGNNGEGDASYISVFCDAKFNLPLPNMLEPADGSTVESIKTIKFGYPAGIQPTWLEQMKILDEKNNVVAYSTDVENVIPESEQDNYNYIVKEVIVTFNNEVTAAGDYTVMIPEGFFSLDLTADGFSVKSNRKCTFSLKIEGEEPQPTINVTTAPAQGKVDELQYIEMTFNDYYTVDWNYNEYDKTPVTFTDNEGNVVTLTLVDVGYGADYDDYQTVSVTLPNTYTAEGDYTLNIPAGALTGNYEPLGEDIVLRWFIGSSSGLIPVVNDVDGKVDVYTINGAIVLRRADVSALNTLPAGIYVVNGKTCVLK